jgi:putative DNA methylase
MSEHRVISPKTLIEVALPLDAINIAARNEKAVPRRGHPQALHYWWARRPLAAARAVIFGQLVHDPEDLWRCQNPGVEPNKQHKGHWTRERGRLFKIIEDLVQWENTTNENVLETARREIQRSWKETCALNKHHPCAADLFNPEKIPALHDPFAGGGAIPLEAQRLGLDSYASDLNPIAVVINKAMIEIPPTFANRSPVHPSAQNPLVLWKGAAGLAEDVRRYGQWIRDEAERQIGGFYPKIQVTPEMATDRPDLEPYVGETLKVLAWQWARTVRSPNPAFSHIDVPLASSFVLGGKGTNTAYAYPVITKGGYRFAVRTGTPPESALVGTTAGKRKGFRCIMSDTPIGYDHIRRAGMDGRLGMRLTAIFAEGANGRLFLSPSDDHQRVAESIRDVPVPDSLRLDIAKDPWPMTCLLYGLLRFDQLFAPRQLLALTTISELINVVRDQVRQDAVAAGMIDDRACAQENSINGASAYADAITVYLSCALSRMASYNNAICHWNILGGSVAQIFSRQAIPMSWDFIEVNWLEKMSGNWLGGIEWVAEVLNRLSSTRIGHVYQIDASSQTLSRHRFVSTDPPYYDNIGYADLSDFFYVWLRLTLKQVYPDLFATRATPKAEELVAAAYRHESERDAEQFFLAGMTKAMHQIAAQAHPAAPCTIYYAFKQAETGADGTNSTGWETFLEAVLRAGFSISGTWPIRTEKAGRMRSAGSNALASSVVLVCRPRDKSLGTISRRQFVRMLNEVLPRALDAMTRESEGLHSPVAPVDLSQAIIGPGMEVFSRYEAVLEADGAPMSVKTALQLINRFLAEDDFDADTQFCLHWFEQQGWEIGKFGEADTLARAKGTSVDGVKQAGVVEAGGGHVRLLRWKDYPADWDARSDSRLPVWEALHQLIRAYQTEGDAGASKVLAAVASKAESSRQLAYRLYTLCERKGWAGDARAYNEVVTGWSSIETAAAKIPGPSQGILFDATKEKA